MSKIAPCLWFNGQAEEAANFYVSLFENSEISNISRWGKVGPFPEGTALMVEFCLAGQRYQALNGGPQFQHSEAISLSVSAKDSAEVDRLWNDLIADGGSEGRCGWLKDRFGVSWQIVPDGLAKLLSDSDPARAKGAMDAMLSMSKLDIEAMKIAADRASE